MESDALTIAGCGWILGVVLECCPGVSELAGVSRPDDEALMNGGRSGGGVGRGLLFAKFRKGRLSLELDEFRDEVRVAIWAC